LKASAPKEGAAELKAPEPAGQHDDNVSDLSNMMVKSNALQNFED